MVAIRFFFCFLLWCGSCVTLAAQARYDQIGEYRFPEKKNRVRIPFQLIHNLIIIPVHINGSPPLNFLVDTGVENSMLTELGFNDSLLLSNVNRTKLRGLGVGTEIEAMTSAGNLIRFAGVEAYNQQMLVLMDNIFDLSSRLGVKVHGIIGHSLFKNFVVEINYATKQMTLYKPGTYPERRARKGTPLRMTIENSKPYVEAFVILSDSSQVPLRLIVDSGMSNSVLLYLPTLPAMPRLTKKVSAYLGRGLNGDIHGHVSRLQGLKLGDYVLHNPPASFPDSVSIEYALKLKNRNGNLGADILQRFRVVFDYGNSQMLLLPNHKYQKPFHFNLSGFELTAPFPGINYYVIASVMPNSPAEAAGLQPGDALVSINGINCHEKTLVQVLSFFETKPGRVIKIKAKRKTEEISTTLALKDVI